ncbi:MULTISPECIES: efflux RND transporter periplasmic adaptor subunit [Methylococcus]|uniref:Efflux RND transporter periplasmic adaptor subunit n=1 Tax=Methylococcus capsulatus TaxID=414 RepID=A0ABZ2F187_METCP|nr:MULTISPECIES: efflux RND transporter periplasmic adaptor subunit [Methylococcus]MDF9392196.1 efflux RND transporter periplasmic adaptor subunit [Methylococcus capsulatus]
MTFHCPWQWLRPCALALALAACHGADDDERTEFSSSPQDILQLPADSPKFRYIREAEAVPEQRPLLEPLTGKITYDETRTARVSSPIAGRVIAIPAQPGTVVHVGTPLLELDSPELGQAQAEYAKATADLKLAEHDFDRLKKLYENGIAPHKEFHQAEDALERARSEAERSRLRLANLGVQEKRPDNHFILKAPIAGVVTERNVNPGMEVRPDLPTPLFVVSDLDRLWVLLDVFEKDLAVIHPGQDVKLTVPAYPDQWFPAKIDYIGKVVDETTRTVKVRCLLPNPEGKLLPSMYASVEVESPPDDKAIVVPLTALFTEGESDWLFVSLGEGRYQKRQVRVGLRLKKEAVLLEGVQPGERIVTDGALLLRSELDTAADDGKQKP